LDLSALKKSTCGPATGADGAVENISAAEYEHKPSMIAAAKPTTSLIFIFFLGNLPYINSIAAAGFTGNLYRL
jgi:hypothetical protein